MDVVWVLVMIAVLCAFGLVAAVAGADTRSGVDGDGALGRRRHGAETWW